jgi:hypothetical protein
MTKNYFTRLLQASLMCCLAVLFTACDEVFGSEDNPIPAYLSMDTSNVTLKVGETKTRTAIAVSTAIVEYSSSDPAIATVDQQGTVKAVSKGTATITATATGYSSASGTKMFNTETVSYKVNVILPVATITKAPTAIAGIKAGEDKAIVTAGEADGGEMKYAVTNTDTKPTSTDGFSAEVPKANGLTAGTHYVWYYVKADDTHVDSEISASGIEVTVAVAYTLLSAATASDVGKVVCAAGHLHTAKTAVPTGCTAVGILGKVTSTGHGLILALQDASNQQQATIKGWTPVIVASTMLHLLPDGARGSLASYTTLGTTPVSNWCVAQKDDYVAIFTNLGSTTGSPKTYDDNVNAYITTGVGGSAMVSGSLPFFYYWSATPGTSATLGCVFYNVGWYDNEGDNWTEKVRPVLGF